MEKQKCSICGKSYANVKLHESKAHKKDMWKLVIPKNLDTDSGNLKLYNFGREVQLDSEGVGFQDNTDYYNYTLNEMEPVNTIKNATALSVSIFVDRKGNVLRNKEPLIEYEITDKKDRQKYTPVDKNNLIIEYK